MSGPDEVRESLGAYLAGALAPDERARVRAHLDTCPACRDEVVDLAGLPGLLGRLREDGAAPGASAASRTGAETGLTVRLAAQAVRERARERRRWRAQGAGVTAAAALALGLVVVPAVTGNGGAGPAGRPSAVAAAPAVADGGGLHVAARTADKAWGTAIRLELTGPAGRARERLMLVAVTTDGRREVAAWWATTESGRVSCDGATSFRRGELDRLLVADAEGRPLVTVRV